MNKYVSEFANRSTTRLLIGVLLLVFLLAACRQKGDAPVTWTVLVYMDGDNNLGNAALADLEEMKSVGSSDRVNIIVQLDLPNNTTTKRYRVVRGSLEIITDLGELDMAAPQTLTDFLVWAKSAYPANRTVLLLWNHGNGWDQGDGPSQPSPMIRRSIFIDQDNNNQHFLPNHEVKKAIEASGISLDLLGMDACTMSTIETLYEFKDLAPVIVSSEEYTDDHGWDYQSLFASLVSHPSLSVEGLARVAVDTYKTYYETVFYPSQPGNPDRLYSLFAVRTRYLGPLAQEVDALAVKLMNLLQDPATQSDALSLIADARDNVQPIDLYIQPYVYVDLVDLNRRLNQETNIATLMDDATIAEYHGLDRPNAHGISIVFFKLPHARTYNTYDPNYINYDPSNNIGNGGDFINQYRWDEFLQAYYSSAGL